MLELSLELDDRRTAGAAMNDLGIVHEQLGEIQSAIAYYERARDALREAGDEAGEARVVGNLRRLALAVLALRLGDALLGAKQHLLAAGRQHESLSRQLDKLAAVRLGGEIPIDVLERTQAELDKALRPDVQVHGLTVGGAGQSTAQPSPLAELQQVLADLKTLRRQL